MNSTTAVDHLVYFVPDLNDGIDEIANLLGARAVAGGRHPTWGTHNALLSLGKSTYLEIMAHDPEMTPPPVGRLFSDRANGFTGLISWAMRTDSIHDLSEKATLEGLPIGRVQNGSRVKSDGSVLRWRLTDPYQIPLHSCTPFLIDWANSTHPSESAPNAGILKSLSFTHPEPKAVLHEFGILGIDFEIKQSQRVSIIASILTPHGEVVLS